MRYLLVLILIFPFLSCEDRFEKEKYDVSLIFKNTTSQVVNLSVAETSDKIKWENKEILPGKNLRITFNIKRDIKSHEGGFIYKAEFSDGESIEKNTGYFTNYKFQDQNPNYIHISKEGFNIE